MTTYGEGELVYEAWGPAGGGEGDATLLTCKGKDPVVKLLEAGGGDAEALYEVRAASWSEAVTLFHHVEGLEPYIPGDEDREEYLKALSRLGWAGWEVNDAREAHGLPRLGWLEGV